MIKITIELWPHGDESKKRILGEGVISNIGGDDKIGDYKCTLYKSPEYAKSPGVWREGKIFGFSRLKLGPWDILYQALKILVGDRS